MNDYISRQAAIDEAKEWIDAVYFEETDRRERKAIECVIGSLKELPSADAVEVVRCKDCVHYMPYDWMFSEVRLSESIDDYPQDEIGCEWIDHHINPEGYCSYGERKEQ